MSFNYNYGGDYVNSSSHIDARMGYRGRSYSMKRNVEPSVCYATKEDIIKKQEELKALKIELAQLQATHGLTGSEWCESRRTTEELAHISSVIDEVIYKIERCDDFIRNAHVIDTANRSNEVVSVFSIVKIMNLKANVEMCIKITELEQELSVNMKSVSPNSPIGKGLLGHRVGDVVSVEVPAGKMNFKVVQIS